MIDFNDEKLKQLFIEIENYLDLVDRSALLFYQAIKKYINNKTDSFSRHFKQINNLETEADKLRSEIRYKLYAFMLIPSSRGDVWGLLENLDNVVDMIEKVVEQFSIEKPEIPPKLNKQFLLIAETSSEAVSQLVKASRAFFKETSKVPFYLNKVNFYEEHIIKISEKVVKEIFSTDIVPIYSRKMHLRDVLEKMYQITVLSQKVSERLSVYAIKRIS